MGTIETCHLECTQPYDPSNIHSLPGLTQLHGVRYFISRSPFRRYQLPRWSSTIINTMFSKHSLRWLNSNQGTSFDYNQLPNITCQNIPNVLSYSSQTLLKCAVAAAPHRKHFSCRLKSILRMALAHGYASIISRTDAGRSLRLSSPP